MKKMNSANTENPRNIINKGINISEAIEGELNFITDGP